MVSFLIAREHYTAAGIAAAVSSVIYALGKLLGSVMGVSNKALLESNQVIADRVKACEEERRELQKELTELTRSIQRVHDRLDGSSIPARRISNRGPKRPGNNPDRRNER
jgi:hypothetical protein